MRFLFDTDTCIDLIRYKPAPVLRRLDHLRPGDVGLSSITAAELDYGAAHSASPEKNRLALARLIAAFPVLPFDHEVARVYGVIRHELESKGTPIGPLDTLIAAHARQAKLILVTHNVREFKRVQGLTVESWS